jgi:hypothetical protein
MRTIKLIALFCFAFSLSQCKTMKLTENAPFTITGATYHNWVGGQPGVRGTNLIIGIENKSETTIESIYFRNIENKPSVENRKGKKYLVVNITTSNGDGNKEIVEISTKESKAVTEVKKNFPFKLESNEAVIKYLVGKKTFYYKVSKIKKTETIFYP